MRIYLRLWREIEARGVWTHEALAYLKQATFHQDAALGKGDWFPYPYPLDEGADPLIFTQAIPPDVTH